MISYETTQEGHDVFDRREEINKTTLKIRLQEPSRLEEGASPLMWKGRRLKCHTKPKENETSAADREGDPKCSRKWSPDTRCFKGGSVGPERTLEWFIMKGFYQH